MTSVSFMLVQIASFWTRALQWFWSVVPKPCSRWPPSEMVLTCGRTICAKLEASCQARYTFCHLQLFNCSLIHPRISGFHLPLLYTSHFPHQNLSYGVQSLPDLWSHTNTSQGDRNCSHMLLYKKLPCFPNPAPFCLSPAWCSWSQALRAGEFGMVHSLLKAFLQLQPRREVHLNRSAQTFCMDLFTSWLREVLVTSRVNSCHHHVPLSVGLVPQFGNVCLRQ